MQRSTETYIYHERDDDNNDESLEDYNRYDDLYEDDQVFFNY